ncbi:SDR family oxidoreductase [Rhizobium sp. RU36D]|uniref:SDR family oxidoreductase n=1 Tax=Rhizobium sp. RU36D TaxID=1907415 RepID=UPI0009D7C0D0|nr:SDR family oxidoreductase [Rhizobium sp. RU36D]SMC57062.1 Nucleoside-diphosphate-sugar epimerase [Rhizobium sp. RU36D]
MKILILGASGFIGATVLQRLISDGHHVTGLARDVARAANRHGHAAWVKADLSAMTKPEDWLPLLQDHEAVINCAGALQDGLSDNVAATQETAMLALYTAARQSGGKRIIQISAGVEGGGADLPFLATKRRADAELSRSGLDSTILRPALVVGRNAHGGTALLRALAAMPMVLPLVYAASPMETVSVDDVAEAVSRAVTGSISGDITLAAPGILTLGDAVALHRAWLGLRPAPRIDLPPWCARPVTIVADLAGRLGWRSPLRSTAMAVMSEGVIGEQDRPAPPFPLRSLRQTLSSHPAGVQDLWFARLYLLKAPVIVTLSLFWLLSGLIPLAEPARAAAHFQPLLPPAGALAMLLFTCALDVALGLAVLVRPFARRALIGMLLLSAGYLLSATLVEPALWADPLGPLVKVLPSILLTLVALATLDER